MKVTCEEARRGLWPPERPRLVGDRVAAARRHVDRCLECGAYFEQDRALLDLYDRARGQRAPLQVRERVYEAISKARWARSAEREVKPKPVLRRAVLPVALVAALAGTILVQTALESSLHADDTAMFVEDYLRRAVGEDHIETNDAAEVRRFLQRELGMQLQPLQLDGLVIARAEICLLEGRRGAMIVYKGEGTEVAHYLVPREGATRAPSLSTPATGSGAVDMPVVIWSTPDVEQALVGGVDSDRLLRMARAGVSD